MNITECHVTLASDPTDTRAKLLAYAQIVVDDALIVRDIRIITGAGGLFLSMPSRRIADRCPQCGAKVFLEARYCSRCGIELDAGRATRRDGPLHVDVCHPIVESCRRQIHDTVLAEYWREVEAARARSV